MAATVVPAAAPPAALMARFAASDGGMAIWECPSMGMSLPPPPPVAEGSALARSGGGGGL